MNQASEFDKRVQSKKTYHRPSLIAYGSVKAGTQTSVNGSITDEGFEIWNFTYS
jgi:hypothetical protein